MLIAGGLAARPRLRELFRRARGVPRFHRSGLHSVVGAVVMSCALALSFFLLDRKWPAGTIHQETGSARYLRASSGALCTRGYGP